MFNISFSLVVSVKMSGFIHNKSRHDASYPRGSGYARFRLHSFFSLISAVAAFPDSPFHCFFSLHLINRDRAPFFYTPQAGLLDLPSSGAERSAPARQPRRAVSASMFRTFRGVSSLGCIPGRPAWERPCAELPHGCLRICFQHKAEYKAIAVHIAHGVGV